MEGEKTKELIPECLEKLKHWRDMKLTHEAHPYALESYAPIYAAIKNETGDINGKKILEIGFGNLLVMLQELAGGGAECWGIDPDTMCPYFIQKKKLSLEDAESKWEIFMNEEEKKKYEKIEEEYFIYPRLNKKYSSKKGWKQVEILDGPGKLFYNHKKLEDLPKLFKNNNFNVIFTNELFEYGSYFMSSQQKMNREISERALNIVYKKLAPSGVFISRTQDSSVLTKESLEKTGFQTKVYNLRVDTSEGWWDWGYPGYLVVCQKPGREK
jgi:SAM-dependent methyltransferase